MHALEPAFDAAIIRVTRNLIPQGFDVSADAPNDYEKLIAHLDAGKRLVVWSGASQYTIYGSAHVNHAFRAWHDWCHWRGRFDFSFDGEVATHDMQRWHFRRLDPPSRVFKLLEAEVVGQALYYRWHKRFPEAQRQFVEAYLTDRDEALLWPLW